MKKMMIAAAFSVAALASFAQTDNEPDTIRVGSMVIIKKESGGGKHSTEVKVHRSYRNRRVTTNWGLVDLGLNNFNDQTTYGSPAVQTYTGNPADPWSAGDFNLRNGKSLNVNVWIFRQRVGLSRGNRFNLTYMLGIETNNFRYENNISYRKYGNDQYLDFDTISFKKNKLATSYFTIPVMLGFSSKPNGGGFTANVGASVGYLYSSRNKQISDQRGKQKIKNNFGLETWKLSFVGEVGFRGFKIYGSYTPTSIYKSGLDMRPYAVGFRLGGWD